MLRDRELRAISGLKIRQTDTKGKCPGSVVERGEIGKVRGIRSAIGLVADGVCSRIRTIPKLVLRQSAKGIPVEQCGKAGFRRSGNATAENDCEPRKQSGRFEIVGWATRGRERGVHQGCV